MPNDSQTTLTANISLKNVYDESQQMIVKFGDSLDNDASNMKKIDENFTFYENLIEGLFDSGYRFPVIGNAK